MKIIRFFLALCFSIAAAEAADRQVKLLGIASGLGTDFATIDIGGNSPEWLRITSLKTGQSKEGVEMGAIDAAKGLVTVKVDGKERQLSMPTDWDYGSTNELDPALPVMYFRALSLENAVSLYSYYEKRTALMHPKLGDSTFSLKINIRTEAEAVEAWEKLFHARRIATIPDGKHLVIVAPFSVTNSITPASDALPKTNSLIPEMSVNFHTAPMGLVLQAYADYLRKNIANRETAMNQLACCDTVTFSQTTPISRDELCYALKTFLAWNNLQFVPDGNEVKLERIHQ